LGAGQFGNAGQPNHAQDKNDYEGKVLRFNTEPDNDPDLYDRWMVGCGFQNFECSVNSGSLSVSCL
jgi:hypothetical protein